MSRRTRSRSATVVFATYCLLVAGVYVWVVLIPKEAPDFSGVNLLSVTLPASLLPFILTPDEGPLSGVFFELIALSCIGWLAGVHGEHVPVKKGDRGDLERSRHGRSSSARGRRNTTLVAPWRA